MALKRPTYPCMLKSGPPVRSGVIRICYNRHTCAFGNTPENLQKHFQLLTEPLIAGADVSTPHATAHQLKDIFARLQILSFSTFLFQQELKSHLSRAGKLLA